MTARPAFFAQALIICMGGLTPGLNCGEKNLRRRLSQSNGRVIKINCTICAISGHGGCVRVLGMGVKGHFGSKKFL